MCFGGFVFVFCHIGGPGNHVFSNGLSFCSEFTYMQEPGSVTTGENDNGRRGTLSSRRNMFLCFIISDQIAVPKKKQKYFLRDTFIIASFDFLSASSKVI